MSTSLVDMAKWMQIRLESMPEIVDVYYGDQDRIPRSPTACIETGEKRQELNGAPRRVMIDLTCYILLYVGPIVPTRHNREEADALAEAVENELHQFPTFEGNFIDTLVTAIEYGYQVRGNSLFRAARLTVTARQQSQLPNSV